MTAPVVHKLEKTSLSETAIKRHKNSLFKTCVHKKYTKQKPPMAVKNKQAHFRAPVVLNSPQKTPWVALRASLQNFKKNPNSFQMVELYNSARTYFISKS